jgi:hypothetical protein
MYYFVQGFLRGFVLSVCLLKRLTRGGENEKEERAKNTDLFWEL